MNILLFFLISAVSSCFLRISPGVMSQGLGGVSITLDEGLTAFHNPASFEQAEYNFTLSRWLYTTTMFSAGASYKNNMLGINYLSYGGIQGYNEFGNPTDRFTPFSISLVLARKIGLFGVSVKGFNEKIDSYTYYGAGVGLSSYIEFEKVSLAAKIDNIGREFTSNTAIPLIIASGAKFSLPENIDIYLESKSPLWELNIGIQYRYENSLFLFGIQYLKPDDLIDGTEIDFDISDLNLSGGVIIQVENYEIGYSLMWTKLSRAHQFCVKLTP